MPQYKVAIVGAGPAGYFAALALQNLQTEEITSNSASGNYCVLTVHRRENWGEGLDAIAQAVFQLQQLH